MFVSAGVYMSTNERNVLRRACLAASNRLEAMTGMAVSVDAVVEFPRLGLG
jgi:hypothetical protein